jgi:hypothetical protein
MRTLAVLLVALLVGTTTAMGAGRHSGRVVSLDPGTGTLRLDELVEADGTEVRTVERTLHLSPDVAIVLRRPARAPAARWPDSWDAEPLERSAIRPGDFVTAITAGDEAVSLEVVRPRAPGAS